MSGRTSLKCHTRGGKLIRKKILYEAEEQPDPSGSGEAIVDMVCRDLLKRKEFGTKKYGEPLMSNNGRNALLDAYEEVLDLVCYLRQALDEDLQRRENVQNT